MHVVCILLAVYLSRLYFMYVVMKALPRRIFECVCTFGTWELWIEYLRCAVSMYSIYTLYTYIKIYVYMWCGESSSGDTKVLLYLLAYTIKLLINNSRQIIDFKGKNVARNLALYCIGTSKVSLFFAVLLQLDMPFQLYVCNAYKYFMTRFHFKKLRFRWHIYLWMEWFFPQKRIMYKVIYKHIKIFNKNLFIKKRFFHEVERDALFAGGRECIYDGQPNKLWNFFSQMYVNSQCEYA